MARTAIITGVLGGIGSATAELLNQNGWSVIGLDCEDLNDVPAYIKEYYKVDVSIDADIEIVANKISTNNQSVDTIINNAAMQIVKPLLEVLPEEWDKVLATNLRSVYSMTRHFYPLIKKNKGSIVNVSSVHALVTSLSIAAYAASKGAVVSLTRAMAIEFAIDNVRVNAILPGAVDTKMLHDGLDRGHAGKGGLEQKLSQLADKTVMKKIGSPVEIAQAINFMADNQFSSFITGQSLVVDGGATIKLSTE